MADEAQPKPKNPTSHKKYEVKGEALERKNRSCPKCGPGFLMAKHNNRVSCGKCGYTEFSKKE